MYDGVGFGGMRAFNEDFEMRVGEEQPEFAKGLDDVGF